MAVGGILPYFWRGMQKKGEAFSYLQEKLRGEAERGDVCADHCR